MKNLLNKYRVQKVIPINYGWSGDKKHILICNSGKKYILRESPQDLFQKRNEQYFYALELNCIKENLTKPIEKGTLENGNFFILYTYLEGENAENAINKYSNTEAYALGFKAGEILQKIHGVKVVHSAIPWYDRYIKKYQKKIESYENCHLKLPKDEVVLQFYKDNLYLMKDRPLVYTHGDYHLGNMVIDNGILGIIDFDKLSIADPYDDLKPYCWNALKSEHFATGLINGYFDNKIPNDFFKILKFYTAESLISHLPWSIKFGKKDIETAFFVYECAMKWYDNFNLTVPTWYLGVK